MVNTYQEMCDPHDRAFSSLVQYAVSFNYCCLLFPFLSVLGCIAYPTFYPLSKLGGSV